MTVASNKPITREEAERIREEDRERRNKTSDSVFGMRKSELRINGAVYKCADKKCPRTIEKGDVCWFDEDGSIYCEICGACIKYHRRKAFERGAANANRIGQPS